MAKVNIEDVKSLLKELDMFLAKAYSAYVHTGATLYEKPRVTIDEVVTLQSKIRVITEIEQ